MAFRSSHALKLQYCNCQPEGAQAIQCTVERYVPVQYVEQDMEPCRYSMYIVNLTYSAVLYDTCSIQLVSSWASHF